LVGVIIVGATSASHTSSLALICATYINREFDAVQEAVPDFHALKAQALCVRGEGEGEEEG